MIRWGGTAWRSDERERQRWSEGIDKDGRMV